MDAIHNLLLYLKIQLLGLPNLAKWGAVTFIGILIVREIATTAWNARARRRANDPLSLTGAKAQGALAGPNPLDASGVPKPTVARGRALVGEDDAPN